MMQIAFRIFIPSRLLMILSLIIATLVIMD